MMGEGGSRLWLGSVGCDGNVGHVMIGEGGSRLWLGCYGNVGHVMIGSRHP